MSEPSLVVSTRKGLFVLEHGHGAWRIARTAFLGDNVALSLADPRDGSWYAVLDLGHFGNKLQRSIDQGRTWNECAVPAYAEGDEVSTGDGKPPQAATLKLIWSLEAGGASEPGRLWAGTVPGGLFRSDDHGASWQIVRALWEHPTRRDWFGGGYDFPGIHSICIDPRDPRCLRVAISTAGVWRSDDAGESWRQIADGMFAEYMPDDQRRDPNVQDVHRLVQCREVPDALWVQHHNGVFRSVAGGGDWQEVGNVQPSVFGFAVAVHPRDPQLAWFVPAIKDERRYPVDGQLVVARTRDGGASFDVLRNGLPQHDAYDLVYRHGLAVDGSGDRLAFGSTTGGLWTSDDQGDRWLALNARLPPIHAVAFADQ
ncbi:WD40/YVTN/BNR-like repeat-containing protein [Montanilutibacter psychrotolerans]|uniref:Exo-alpha-sialidase n=1 Tax=Montanilutibacter psychrotolerans TaxID=1327343 RepID=A0A3M8SN48_9GAMM|nr:sialidase family protein [Lysobacter psychrotolerans]RNF82659.1 exo-alpha-sialidase [Lysobacter psychrotolerans]